MNVRHRNAARVGRFVFACLLVVGLVPSAASAAGYDLKVGKPEVRTPSGQAKPERPASPAQIAPKLTTPELKALAENKQGPAKPSGVKAPSAPPLLFSSFEGAADVSGLRPPDTHGAVGLSQFVEVTNSKFDVFSKTTGVNTKSVSLASFFGYTTTTIFDPRVVYDKDWKRWVVTAEAFPESGSGPQFAWLAISTTDDATGPFIIYKYNSPRGVSTNFYDYPMLGMDQDALIVTANIFNSSDTYVDSNVLSFAKADMYNGLPATGKVDSFGTGGTVAPPIVDSNDSNALFLQSGGSGSTLNLYRGRNLGRGSASLGPAVSVPASSYTATGSADQFSDATNNLDVLNRFQDHSTQIVQHVLNTRVSDSGGLAIGKYWQISALTNAEVLSGFFFESGPSEDFNPAVAGSAVGGTGPNPIGRMVFTWTSTVAPAGGHDARVKGGGRLATDPLTFTGGSDLSTSTTFYDAGGETVERWGDYSSVSVDPTSVTGCAAGNRFYVVNEKINSTTLWGSTFGRLGFC